MWVLIKNALLSHLTFTTHWANSADDKLVKFFLFFPENRIWHLMQIPVGGKNKKNISLCHLLKFYPDYKGLKHRMKIMDFVFKEIRPKNN